MKTILIAASALVLAGCAAFNAPQSTIDRFTVEQH